MTAVINALLGTFTVLLIITVKFLPLRTSSGISTADPTLSYQNTTLHSANLYNSTTSTKASYNFEAKYTYDHCPFLITKYSQFRLHRDGPFESEQDYHKYSIHRAELALNFSNSVHSRDRILSSFESGAFDDRKIILDGE